MINELKEKYLLTEDAVPSLFRTIHGMTQDAEKAYRYNNLKLVEEIMRKGLPPVIDDILTELRKKK